MSVAPATPNNRTIHDMRGTAPMPKLRIILPRPHDGLQIVRSQRHRFNWLCAGRRWEKTSGVALTESIEGALEGRDVLFGAPRYDQVMTLWEELQRAVPPELAEFNQGRGTVTFTNRPGAGRIMARTLNNPHNARSKTADRVILDEAAYLKAVAWHEVVRPMLVSTGGDAWIMSTPSGLNWFYEEHLYAQSAADSMAWQAPARGARIDGDRLIREPHPLENTRLEWSEFVGIFEKPGTVRRSFRQEYLAEFVDGGDMVFAAADVAALPSGWLGDAGPVKGRRYLHAWDLGRKRDATVGVTIDWTLAPYQVVAYERMIGVPWPAIQDAIAKRHRTYGGTTWVEENGVGDPVIGNLDVHAEPFNTTGRSKVHAITALQFLLEAQQLKLGAPQAIAELRSYRWDDDDLVQDSVMALAIAASALPKPDRRVLRPVVEVEYREPDRYNRPSLTGAEMDW